MTAEEDIKKVVIARLETLSPTKKISIGSAGEFTIDELIERVKEDDPIGKKLIQIELDFIRLFKKGILI